MARTQAATLEALPARDVVDEVSTNRRLLGRLLKNRAILTWKPRMGIMPSKRFDQLLKQSNSHSTFGSYLVIQVLKLSKL